MKVFANILILLICLNANGQDYIQDFNEVSVKFENAENMHLMASIKVFSRVGGTKIYSANSEIKLSGATSITKIEAAEVYKNSTHEVHVNYESNVVYIHKTKHYSEKDFSKKTLDEIRSYLELEKNPKKDSIISKLVSNVLGVKTYEFLNVKGMEKMLIILDMNTKKIREIRYHFLKEGPQKGSYCVIKYDVFDFTPKFKNTLFLSENYFSETQGKYHLSNRFKNFKLLQQ